MIDRNTKRVYIKLYTKLYNNFNYLLSNLAYTAVTQKEMIMSIQEKNWDHYANKEDFAEETNNLYQ